MDSKEAKRILADDEELDLASLAEARSVEQEKSNKSKKNVPGGRERSLVAWEKLKRKRMEEESFRRKLAKVWNNKKI